MVMPMSLFVPCSLFANIVVMYVFVVGYRLITVFICGIIGNTGLHSWDGKSATVGVCIAGMNATAYFIWHEKNGRKRGKGVINAEQKSQNLKSELLVRLKGYRRKKMSQSDVEYYSRLHIT